MQLTPPRVQVALFLVEHAGERHWLQDMCRRTGLKSGVVHPVLQRMFDAGWLDDEWAGDPPHPPTRRYYRVSKQGGRALEALLARARGDGRFTQLFPKPPAPTFQQPRRTEGAG